MPTRPDAFDKPRWTEADARMVLGALARSGQTVRAFADQHGLDPQRLYSWRRRVAEGDRTTFREVVVRADVTAEHRAFELALPSGIRVRVPSSFDLGALTRLLRVLKRTDRC